MTELMQSKNIEFKRVDIHSISDWRPQHSAGFQASIDGGYLISDGEEADWHIIRIRDPQYIAELKLTAIVEPLSDSDTDFYVNHWGGKVVCSIGPEGTVRKTGTSLEVTCNAIEGGRYKIEAIFNNRHETLSVGVTDRFIGPRYKGRNRDQWRVYDLQISHRPLIIDGVDNFVVVDVGARGGVSDEWLSYKNQVEMVLVEPHPIEAKRLREQGYTIVEKALSNAKGKRPLYITRLVGCSSLLEPNHDVLSRFNIAPAFDVTSTEEVETERYDALVQRAEAPMPDILKIDVQGFEYEVLEGFGDLLYYCSAIELEAHFYQIYKDQKLLGDLVSYLDRYDFSLRKLEEQKNFDGERLEFNAFFTKRLSNPYSDLNKLRFIEDIWQLNVADGGRRLVRNL